MSASKWVKKLRDMEGVVKHDYNPFLNVIRTPSPSVNFAFGKGNGLPKGYSAVYYGPPGGGKSYLLNLTIGQFHRDYPDGIAVKIDAEMRDEAQLTPADYDKFGIDQDRLVTIAENRPIVFDIISKDLLAMVQEGAPIGLLGIDSVNAIQGRRFQNQTTIMTQQIGDHALTIQEGLKSILTFQRRHHVGLICTAHVRAEMDTLEQMRGNKTKMAASFGLQHHIEYFLYVERNRNKAAKADILGKAFENDSVGDVDADNAETTGHKIRAIMKKSSMGVAGRVGEFTIDYNKGFINVHEEVFLLGINRGVIARPNNRMYVFDGKEYDGKPAMVAALRDHPEMQAAVIKELLRKDAAGEYAAADKLVEDAMVLEDAGAEEAEPLEFQPKKKGKK